MSAHTPGPWRLADAHNPRVILIDGPHGAVGEFVDFRKMADARLIAAAPAMLYALQNIYANAAESPEYIRARIADVIAAATGAE
jgi:hypothetical protein